MKPIAALCLFAILLAGCNDTAANQSCTSYCFSLNGVENDSPEQVDAKIKKMCEDMGRQGKPEVQSRSKSSVSGYCPA